MYHMKVDIPLNNETKSNNGGFGITYPLKIDMPLNNETKPKQTKFFYKGGFGITYPIKVDITLNNETKSNYCSSARVALPLRIP